MQRHREKSFLYFCKFAHGTQEERCIGNTTGKKLCILVAEGPANSEMYQQQWHLLLRWKRTTVGDKPRDSITCKIGCLGPLDTTNLARWLHSSGLIPSPSAKERRPTFCMHWASDPDELVNISNKIDAEMKSLITGESTNMEY